MDRIFVVMEVGMNHIVGVYASFEAAAKEQIRLANLGTYTRISDEPILGRMTSAEEVSAAVMDCDVFCSNSNGPAYTFKDGSAILFNKDSGSIEIA